MSLSEGDRTPPRVHLRRASVEDSPTELDLKRLNWAPLRLTLIWLVGTYVAFLLGPLATQMTNLGKTTTFIVATIVAFTLGYRWSLSGNLKRVEKQTPHPGLTSGGRAAIATSALWFLVFGVASLANYGAASFGDILNSIQHPADSYAAKFTVYQQQIAESTVSRPIQLVVLFGALSAPAIPLATIFWRHLGSGLKTLTLAGVGSYVMYFLFIGTNKGLGDVSLLFAFGIGIRIAHDRRDPNRRQLNRRLAKTMVAVGAVAFLAFMANSQADRAQKFGTTELVKGNSVVAAVLGDRLATGVSAVTFYPTHGYLGLSKDLDTEFEWAGGLGASPALASYKTQYLGGTNPYEKSYPARTEVRTGWPAGLYWSTMYPWLASDLTFPGTIAFCFILGALTARLWLESIISRDLISIILLSQIAILILYIPANNQLFLSRQTALGTITLLGIYFYMSVRRSVAEKSWTSK